VPTYDPNEPFPVSALDGFVFDDLPTEGQEVLEAITHVETTNNVEAEAQVLEAMETVSPHYQAAALPENPHDDSVDESETSPKSHSGDYLDDSSAFIPRAF
jgi:hypothetical protein